MASVEQKTQSKVARTCELLRHDILRGIFKPGAILPTQRELSERYGVGQGTTSAAIGRLIHEGLAVTVQGSGSFVVKELPAQNKVLDFIRMRQPPGVAEKQITLDWIEWFTQASQEGGRIAHWHHLTYEEVKHTKKIVERFRNSNGVIIYSVVPPDLPSLLYQQGIPLITVDTAAAGSPATFFSQITFDRRAACRQATEYLISLGCSRIGFVRTSGPAHESGFLDAMINHPLPLRTDWLLNLAGDINHVEDDKHKLCIELCTKLLTSANRPEAIVCPTIHIAHALELTALKLGLNIPQDLAIIKGGPESRSIFGQVPVPITSVGPSVEQTCRKALEVIEAVASGPKPQERHFHDLIVMPLHLTIRDSCGARVKNSRATVVSETR